ncbi:LOG family protein [Roseibacillus ishigakijimensis]|uniref:AMP nucleosidase n=1 Tax=Roseibacillus ishigakijimensis TaxID=454146 RepID=A0A934RQT8_9BACT|nr:LOG family protein [Roseibacillus ishigakijimensis]MBK1833921.1 LOG family protein [Roseibacillus ishigakijimensis]
MPKVRLSGTVLGPEDPSRSARARLLFHLFNAGWDIYNSNGDQQITLANIEEKIIESDAFVFTPGASLQDLFKAISVFVGYQTLDKNLANKPTVILNDDGSWDPLFRLLEHLHDRGTVRQNYRDYLLIVDSPSGVVKALEEFRDKGLPPIDREAIEDHPQLPADAKTPPPTDLQGRVCVFCSATIEKEGYLADGEELGRQLAEHKLGCVSGAGKSGVMGAVVRGSVAAGGWTAGSNVPHIIRLEGLPEGLSYFWLRDDIYTRMEVMIENSEAFVIFPGGSGTVQELLALMIFLEQGDAMMKGKPVVIFNRRDQDGIAFWDPLIKLLENYCCQEQFTVVDDLHAIVPTIEEKLARQE